MKADQIENLILSLFLILAPLIMYLYAKWTYAKFEALEEIEKEYLNKSQPEIKKRECNNTPSIFRGYGTPPKTTKQA